MRRDAYCGNTCSDYRLIYQATVCSSEFEGDEGPDRRHLPIVLREWPVVQGSHGVGTRKEMKQEPNGRPRVESVTRGSMPPQKPRTMPKPKHASDSEVSTRKTFRSIVPAREPANQSYSYLALPNGLIWSSVPHSSQRRPMSRAKSASTCTVSQAPAHRKVSSRQMAFRSPSALSVEQAGNFQLQHELCCRCGVLTACFSRCNNASHICRIQSLRLCLSPCYRHLRIVGPYFLPSHELQRWL